MTTASARHPGSAQVLLVEDDDGDARIVRDLLETADAGLHINWARSIREAAQLLSAETVCILLDMALPDTVMSDGLRQVLELAGPVPVVVLTGFADAALGAAAVAQGAQDYLVKGSVNGESLARAIRYAVERKRGEETGRRLREADLLAAEKARLERGLLPQPVIANPHLRWVTRYRPGGGRALLGGDFFDAIELPDGTVRIIVGDVTGHGPDEAALGAALRVGWRALVIGGVPTDDVLPHLDRLLRLERLSDDVFTTVCDLSIRADLARAEMRLGGHPSPLLIRSGEVEEVTPPSYGPLLGLLDGATWPSYLVELGDEWGLIIYTDGVIEGRAEDGGRLDAVGLRRIATDALIDTVSLAELADDLLAGAEAANDGPLVDDVALFLLAAGHRWH